MVNNTEKVDIVFIIVGQDQGIVETLFEIDIFLKLLQAFFVSGFQGWVKGIDGPISAG